MSKRYPEIENLYSSLTPEVRAQLREVLNERATKEEPVEAEFSETVEEVSELGKAIQSIRDLHQRIPENVLKQIRANNEHVYVMPSVEALDYLLHDYGLVISVLSNVLQTFTTFSVNTPEQNREIVHKLMSSSRSAQFAKYDNPNSEEVPE